ncbi:hypothetical protein COLO4_02876 [Corchorus olitorius]|uniref:Uncharacterized protein n=1 Tax=Corchorus olitorius TaxID=93759 RepID=A0A1R3L055_9ROSI|nr:hypothetical protein COLO4_02876 [Corchorus olitorius]
MSDFWYHSTKLLAIPYLPKLKVVSGAVALLLSPERGVCNPQSAIPFHLFEGPGIDYWSRTRKKEPFRIDMPNGFKALPLPKRLLLKELIKGFLFLIGNKISSRLKVLQNLHTYRSLIVDFFAYSIKLRRKKEEVMKYARAKARGSPAVGGEVTPLSSKQAPTQALFQ